MASTELPAELGAPGPPPPPDHDPSGGAGAGVGAGAPAPPAPPGPPAKAPPCVLPIDAHADRIVAHVRAHPVTVIHGETGCGKSSRVPLILLEATPEAKMFVSQPRRIAARALCERVRDTHSDPDEIALRLGHGVRDEAAGKARVIFVTCGYLVRLVAHHPERLADHTHVVIDEVHERTVDADVLCLLCRRLLELRPELRLVLMSATLAGGLYCDYFKCPPPIFVGAKRFPVDVVFADDIATGAVSRVVGHRFGGRSEAAALQAMRLANPQIEGAEQLQPWERKRKEVQEQRKKAAREKLEAEGAAGSSADDALEDAPHAELGKFQHELVVAVCCALARDASKSCALVFVPGMADIGDLTDRLEARGGAYVGDVAGAASELRRFECVPVHSELPHEDQARAFAPATDGRFKVVLATNSAESSVTLPDCDDVLDLGTHKALRYDAASHRAVLAPAWVSRASATQRAGRTGRVRPGRCWRLYGKRRFDDALRDHEVSEIHRQPLDAVVLNLRAMIDAPVGPLLASTLEPPKTQHVNRALAALRESGLLGAPERSANAAASAEGALTPTGAFVAALGVDLRLGRLVALGVALGVGPLATGAAAALSLPKSPLRSANPLVHGDPGEYNSLVRDGLLARAAFDGGDYCEPAALMRLERAYAAAPDKHAFCRRHCVAHGRARQCAQASANLRSRVRDALAARGDAAAADAAGRPPTADELGDPVQLNALRALLAWTMREQIIKAKAARGAARRGGARGGRGRAPPPPRAAAAATVLLAGDGARDLRARHVLGLFPPECLFRYDAGVRTTLTSARPSQAPRRAVVAALHDLAAHFSLSGAWCVFPAHAAAFDGELAPDPRGGGRGRGRRQAASAAASGAVAAWVARDVLDVPGAAELLDAVFDRRVVDAAARRYDDERAREGYSYLVLLETSASKARLKDLRSLLEALPAAVHCYYGARREGVAATASFGGADARDDAKLEFALETTFFGADPLRGQYRWAPQILRGKPALRFAPDGEKGRQAWEAGEPRPPLLNDLPVGARLLSAMAMGYRDNQLRVWADRPGGPPRYPGLPPEPPSRRAVAVKLDVPKPAWKLVFAPASAGASAPPSAQVLTPFHSLAAVAVHHAADDRDATVYAVAGAMVDTAGGGARAESVTVLPPGDEWLGLALRCARDPRSLPPDALEAKLAKAARPDLARAADAFRDAAGAALRGRARPDAASGAALLAGLAAVFRPWLPASAADDALAARLERLGPPSAGAVPPHLARGAIAQILARAPGRALAFPMLDASFARAVGFPLSPSALAEHTGEPCPDLGAWLLAIPGVSHDRGVVSLAPGAP